MNRSLKKNIVVLLGTGAAALCGCGTLAGDQPLAGGSGAGNPGGSVVLAMSATGGRNPGTGLNKTTAAGKQSSTVIDSSGSIVVTDKGGQQIKLTGVTVSNVTARFMLDISEKPDSLLSGMPEAPPGLSADSNSIVYAGTHEFDAVQGMVDSSVAALQLPIGRYCGVTIGFQEFSSSGPQDQQDVHYSQVTMNGSFLYGGAMHKLIIGINYVPMASCQNFSFGGGIFTLSSADTTHLDLQFNAAQWFAGVDLAASLGQGGLSFDSTGTLDLNTSCPNPCAWGIQSVIADAFFSSGKLVVY